MLWTQTWAIHHVDNLGVQKGEATVLSHGFDIEPVGRLDGHHRPQVRALLGERLNTRT